MGPIYNGKSADKSQIYSVTSPKVEKYIFQKNPHFPLGKYVFSNVFNPLSQQYFHLPGHLHPFTHAQLLPPQCCSMRHAWRLRRHHVLVRLHGYYGSLHATIQDETVYDCLVPKLVFSFLPLVLYRILQFLCKLKTLHLATTLFENTFMIWTVVPECL